jgi:hypothetical protein
MVCPEFWLHNPKILWQDAKEFFPFMEINRRCTASALNSFTRFGIYLSIVLALIRMQPAWLLVGLIFAGLAISLWYWMNRMDSIRESFLDIESPIVDPEDVNGRYAPDIIGATGRTEPTAANPFMNVLMTEYSDSPLRFPAKSGDSGRVGSALDQYFDTMFNRDPGDVFQKTQGQRQFVTMPSTSIPNDQESYMNWLYRTPGQTCKEGNTDVCVFDTGPASYPWREIASPRLTS